MNIANCRYLTFTWRTRVAFICVRNERITLSLRLFLETFERMLRQLQRSLLPTALVVNYKHLGYYCFHPHRATRYSGTNLRDPAVALLSPSSLTFPSNCNQQSARTRRKVHFQLENIRFTVSILFGCFAIQRQAGNSAAYCWLLLTVPVWDLLKATAIWRECFPAIFKSNRMEILFRTRANRRDSVSRGERVEHSRGWGW